MFIFLQNITCIQASDSLVSWVAQMHLFCFRFEPEQYPLKKVFKLTCSGKHNPIATKLSTITKYFMIYYYLLIYRRKINIVTVVLAEPFITDCAA